MKVSTLWFTTSYCPPETTVYSWQSEQAARDALRMIDETGCGHLCLGKKYHVLSKKESGKLPEPLDTAAPNVI